MHAHTHTKMQTLGVAFVIFFLLFLSQNGLALKQTVRVCGALCLSWDTVIRSTLTAHPQTRGTRK